MEKSRIRPVPAGKSVRMSYSRQKEVLEMPNLIEIQKDSYQWFLDEGLKEAFADISPIADFAGHLSLEFVDFTLCRDDIKYTIEECKERDATYAAPLKVKVRLYNKDKDEMNEHEIFMGDLPLMTDTGSFVINGAERVIVSQLVRSPGIYYGIGHDKVGKELFTCTVIPNRGAWLEYETDSNDVFYVRVDRTRKVPVTVLIRALGYGTNAEILDLFGEEPKLLASFGKDTADNYQEFTDSTKVYEPVSKQLDEKEHAKKKVWLNIYNASDNFLSSTYQPLLKNYDDLLNLDVEYIGGDGQTESNITNRLGNPSQYDAFAINMVKTDNAASYTSLLEQ